MKELSWAQRNPEKRRLHRKRYREKNKDKIKTLIKNWEKKNYEKRRKYFREYNLLPYVHEKQMIRQKSRRISAKLGLAYECVECGAKNDLHLHHHKYTTNIEDFDYLCPMHHLRLHGGGKSL